MLQPLVRGTGEPYGAAPPADAMRIMSPLPLFLLLLWDLLDLALGEFHHYSLSHSPPLPSPLSQRDQPCALTPK